MEDTVKAVILAGGRGRRLEPYTSVLPKPLMPVGDRAIVEIIVDRLVECGIKDITLCVGYLAHLIEAVFNGRPRGARMSYVHEAAPLGTAGPLRLVEGLSQTFLMMNGDLLTDLRFDELVDVHRRAGNIVTIATHERRHVADYGVLHTVPGESPRLVAYEEKPESSLTVSMGVYVIEPEALERVPASGYFDFPQLIQCLLDEGLPVGTFPFEGFWLDIGRRDDYEQALEHWKRHVPSAGDGSWDSEQPSLFDELVTSAGTPADRDPTTRPDPEP
jgi:NDP-mannose synthase